jgi:ribulose-5-phosphate 4-epimerase/fuculose-1-phosphate aldolase
MNPVETFRHAIVECGHSLFSRGLATGSSGNVSVRLDDGAMLITPTNISLGKLDPDMIAHVEADGTVSGGMQPSKEYVLHQAVYRARPAARAVVHLHATHSAAVSCMAGLCEENCLPPLTAYHVMKVGPLPLIPYHRPGDPALAGEVGKRAVDHGAMLLANHGPVVAGNSLRDAMNRIEELEETAKLFLMLRGSQTSPLTPRQIDDLVEHFGAAH